MELRVEVALPVELGQILRAWRRVIPILGGSFSGPLLRGEVLPGGADWQISRSDGVAVLEARYTLKTDTGHLISVANRGFRHGKPDLNERLLSGQHVPRSDYYFMTTPLFETSSVELQWLMRSVFIGEGERKPDCVVFNVWQVGTEPS
jgi:hypothetical protein